MKDKKNTIQDTCRTIGIDSSSQRIQEALKIVENFTVKKNMFPVQPSQKWVNCKPLCANSIYK